MKPPRRVFIAVTNRIGDVLLATPLIHSLKLAWPQAQIDVLVFDGTQGVISANPDIHRVLTVPERPGFWQHLRLLARIARRYDIALSPLANDRPTLYAWIAGRWRAGLLLDEEKHRWKQKLLHRWAAYDGRNTHTVAMCLKLADLLGIPRHYDVIVTWTAEDEKQAAAMLPFDPRSEPYAVLHACPKYNYKMWRPSGWVELGRWLGQQGMRVVLTGGNDAAEVEYVTALAREIPETINLAGRASLRQAAYLMARARVFVGPDTVASHMAAALGTPTVALFGPSSTVKWAPWPKDATDEVSPYLMRGSQHVGNVYLVQGTGDCVPCFQEGCDRNIKSFSACLQQISTQTVIDAVEAVTRAAIPIRETAATNT